MSGERTVKQVLEDEIERQLRENPPQIPTYEEFLQMVEDYKKNTPWWKRLRDHIEISLITREFNRETNKSLVKSETLFY